MAKSVYFPLPALHFAFYVGLCQLVFHQPLPRHPFLYSFPAIILVSAGIVLLFQGSAGAILSISEKGLSAFFASPYLPNLLHWHIPYRQSLSGAVLFL